MSNSVITAYIYKFNYLLSTSDVKKVEHIIKKTWKELCQLKEKSDKLREENLQELLSLRQLANEESRAKAILEIKKAEKQCRQQIRIKRVTGKIKRGIRTVKNKSTNEDGTEKWTSMTNRKEIEKSIMEHKINHLGKAEEKPFAHGEPYQELRNKINRENIVREIINGTTEWRHPMKEVECWIKNLCKQYDEENLKEKASESGSILSYDVYHSLFKKKK